jgi:hypothetical protein
MVQEVTPQDSSPAPAVVKCRGCGIELERFGQRWGDRNGFTACIKGGLPGSGRPFVLHEPMPAGLEGAAPAT